MKLGGDCTDDAVFAGCCSLCSQVVAVFAGLCSQVVAGLCRLWSSLCRSLQVAVRSQSQVVAVGAVLQFAAVCQLRLPKP